MTNYSSSLTFLHKHLSKTKYLSMNTKTRWSRSLVVSTRVNALINVYDKYKWEKMAFISDKYSLAGECSKSLLQAFDVSHSNLEVHASLNASYTTLCKSIQIMNSEGNC